MTGTHIEKTAEFRTAGDVRLRGDFGIISQLCVLHARQVRANRASERLYDRDFRGRISTHPRAGTATRAKQARNSNSSKRFQLTPARGQQHEWQAGTAYTADFNSPPRGDGNAYVYALKLTYKDFNSPPRGDGNSNMAVNLAVVVYFNSPPRGDGNIPPPPVRAIS